MADATARPLQVEANGTNVISDSERKGRPRDLFCGFIAVAGQRGSTPTMVLGRAAFGVRGNKLPSIVSWLLTVGWEIVLVILATRAVATVFGRLGWSGGTATKVVALVVVVGLTIFGGVMGFDLIMRMQTVITVVTAMLTAGFIALPASHIHFSAVSAVRGGSPEEMIGAATCSRHWAWAARPAPGPTPTSACSPRW